jgi:succinyl-CoA synthetase (ADP-forming) beta subunit (EC 6.2.1.5)
MKIHEYQAKKMLRDYDIPTPRGEVADSPATAKEIASLLNIKVVIKAQVHAGGRGKAGGIRLAASPEEAFVVAKEILGMTLITPQTGSEGKCVRKVLVEEASQISKELYLSLAVDRSRHRECLVYIASEAGGMDIEDTAKVAPEKIITAAVSPASGYSPFLSRKLGYGLGLTKPLNNQFTSIMEALYQMFLDKDASLVEINPLGITEAGKLIALDIKITFDDDGLSRHPEIRAMRDESEEDSLEVEAVDAGITYIKLDGNVGCMVNGAGLAMTTMDLIKLAGGEPANFLDVGGGASPQQVAKAFRILTSDPKVKVILVNIFGGILRCDRAATGLIEAASQIEKRLPMVVRLQGTNVEEGRRLLQQSDLTFDVAEELYHAAQKAVGLSKRS